MYFIYLLRCQNQSLYCGYTNNLSLRLKQHCTGKGGAKYTKCFKPIGLAAAWQCEATQGDVLRFEYKIKQLAKSDKELLVKNPGTLLDKVAYDAGDDFSVEHLSKQQLDDLWHAV